MVEAIRGLTTSGCRAIADLAHRHLENRWHTGAQVAVYRDGELQLEVRVGEAAGEEHRLLYFSATKPLVTIGVLTLIERGQIELDTPLVRVWPEFGQGGKADCTLRHVLTHQGGFPVFDRNFDWKQIDDWTAIVQSTAAIEAEWPPGTDTGYHPLTFGIVLGELIRRIDGREPREFMQDELFEPLGMKASIGITDRNLEDQLVLPIAMSEATFDDPNGIEKRTSEIVNRFRLGSTLRAQLPAANAIGTAEALARFYSMLERRWNDSDAFAGICPLSRDLLRMATRVQNTVSVDRTSHLPASYGLGFIVDGAFPPFNEPDVFGHGGQQSVISYADPVRGLAVAYLTNGLQEPLTVQLRTEEMVTAVIEACR